MPNRKYEPCGTFAGVSGAKYCKVPQIEQRASPIAATFMGQLAPAGMFVYSALVMSALGVFGYYRTRRRAAKSGDERSRYIVTPGAQFTSEELYATVRNQMDKDLARIRLLDS